MIEKVKEDVAAMLQPSTNFLVRSRVTPDILTMIGLALNGVAAALFGMDEYRWGGFTVLFAGLFDLLDGQVARDRADGNQVWSTSRFHSRQVFRDYCLVRPGCQFHSLGFFVDKFGPLLCPRRFSHG